MPIYKRAPRVQEILSYGVEQARRRAELRMHTLRRPLEEWARLSKDLADEPQLRAPSVNRKRKPRVRVESGLLLLFARVPYPLAAASKLCELLLASKAYTLLRLCVAPIAFFNLAYLAPQKDLSINSTTDLAVFWLDIVVNVVFFVQSVFQILGTPIRCQIDLYLKHASTTSEIVGQSGVLALLVTAICFFTGSQTPQGLWFRLLRLGFIVNTLLDRFPESYILLSGMGKGLQSTSYSLVFLLNLILMYASIGHFLYAQSDPFHFASFSMSLVSWFQVATFDNWTNIYYSNLGGCDSIDTEYTGTQESSPAPVDTHFGRFFRPRCDNPRALPESAVVLFWSFCFLGSFVLLSVSLAAVAIGIMAKLDEIKNQDDVVKVSAGRAPSIARRLSQLDTEGEHERMREILHALWRHDLAEPGTEEATLVEEPPSLFDRLRVVKSRPVRLALVWLVYASAVLQLLVNLNDSNIDIIQISIQTVLSADLLARALLLYPHVWRFLLSPMRVMDLVGVALIWLPLLLPRNEDLKILQFLYFFRVFVTLREFLYVDTLSSIVQSIGQSVGPFSYVLLLLFVFYYFFAVAGILLFREADPYHWGSYGRALNTLLQLMTLDNWAWIMKINMLGCANMGYATGFPRYDGVCAAAGGGRGMGWFAPLHFISFIVASAMILLSLLIGMVLSTLTVLREEQLARRAIVHKASPFHRLYKFSAAEVALIEQLFLLLDTEEQGALKFASLLAISTGLGLRMEELQGHFLQTDTDGSGVIDFAEFSEMLGRMRAPRMLALSRQAEKERVTVHYDVQLFKVHPDLAQDMRRV